MNPSSVEGSDLGAGVFVCGDARGKTPVALGDPRDGRPEDPFVPVRGGIVRGAVSVVGCPPADPHADEFFHDRAVAVPAAQDLESAVTP